MSLADALGLFKDSYNESLLTATKELSGTLHITWRRGNIFSSPEFYMTKANDLTKFSNLRTFIDSEHHFVVGGIAEKHKLFNLITNKEVESADYNVYSSQLLYTLIPTTIELDKTYSLPFSIKREDAIESRTNMYKRRLSDLEAIGNRLISSKYTNDSIFYRLFQCCRSNRTRVFLVEYLFGIKLNITSKKQEIKDTVRNHSKLLDYGTRDIQKLEQLLVAWDRYRKVEQLANFLLNNGVPCKSDLARWKK